MPTSYQLVPQNTMDNQRVTWPLIFSLLAATLSSFVFGFNVGVINAPAQLIKNWIQNESYPYVHGDVPSDYLFTEIWSWIAGGCFQLGGCLGGLLSGYAADKLGRKGAMLATGFLTLVAALLMGISKMTHLYMLLIIGRLVVGISCGLFSVLPAIYLTEISPLRLRGLFGSCNTVFVILGIFISQLLGLSQILGTDRLWPLLLAFTAIPAILQLITLPFCPESPKYLLVIKKNRDQAQTALMRLRKSNDVSQEIQSMIEETKFVSQSSITGQTMRKSFWWGVLICMINHISQHVTGVTAVLYFSSSIFIEQAGMERDKALAATLGVGAIFLVSGLVSTMMIDRVGRRFLMLFGLIGTCFSDAMIFLTLHLLAVDKEAYKIAAYFAIIFVYLFIFAFAIGPASIPWFYTSELFEPMKRGKVNAIATTTNWLSGFIVSYTFLPLKNAIGEYVFLMFVILSIGAIIYLSLFAPETKGKTCNENMQAMEMRRVRFCKCS